MKETIYYVGGGKAALLTFVFVAGAEIAYDSDPCGAGDVIAFSFNSTVIVFSLYRTQKFFHFSFPAKHPLDFFFFYLP